MSLQRSSLKASQPPSSPFAGEPEDDEADVQEVEMVLETYFMHIDNTYNKLQTLTEYIDDTEVRRGSRAVTHAHVCAHHLSAAGHVCLRKTRLCHLSCSIMCEG